MANSIFRYFFLKNVNLKETETEKNIIPMKKWDTDKLAHPLVQYPLNELF